MIAIDTTHVIMKITAREITGILGETSDKSPTASTATIVNRKKLRFSNGKIFMKSNKGNKINSVDTSDLLENAASPSNPKIPPEDPMNGDENEISKNILPMISKTTAMLAAMI